MARSALLNTDTEDLKELFSNGKSYTVPPYQRDYSGVIGRRQAELAKIAKTVWALAV
jgi:hypothetical protein